LLALVLTLAALGLSSGTAVTVWLVSLGMSLPLTVRRRWPIPVFGVVIASALVAELLGMSGVAPVLALAVALYSVALSVRPRRSAIALGAALLVVTLKAVLSAKV